MNKWRKIALELVGALSIGALSLMVAPGAFAATQDWPMYNGDAEGTRSNSSDGAPTPSDLRSKGLEVKWSVSTPGAVFGTPAVVGGKVYAGDTSGNVFAINSNGTVQWTYPLPGDPPLGEIRSSPLVVGNRVIIASMGLNAQTSPSTRVLSDAGKIYGFYRNAEPGHPAGTLAYTIDSTALGNTSSQLSFDGSPTLAKNALGGNKDLVVIGMASVEEDSTQDLGYACCNSRGGVAAFNPVTGQIAWVYRTISPNEATAGSSGASVWSTPTYDATSRTIYVSTGNNFSEPSTLTSDAIIALNATNGSVRWITQLTANDTWNYRFPISNEQPDSDFGDSPNFFQLQDGRKVVAAGQKSGFFHMLDATTGQVLAQYDVVPYGVLGGLFADSARDKTGISFVNGITQYCAGFTPDTCSDTIHEGLPKGSTIAAIRTNSTNLQELWRFEIPDFGVLAIAGLGVAKGAVYTPVVDFFQAGRDKLYAFDANTGEVLTTLGLSQASSSGPAISGGLIHIGTGAYVPAAGFFQIPGSITAIGVK